MGSGHGHDQPNAGATHRWRLRVAFVLIAAFFVVEVVAALASGSLSLLSDAGHMAADVVALGAALVATRIAARPDTTGRRTFGSYRAEVFASGLAVLLMLGVAAYIVVAAVGRIGDEPEVASTAMLVVGALGLVVNLVALVLLRGGATESLNVKGAYLEVVADTVGSLGVDRRRPARGRHRLVGLGHRRSRWPSPRSSRCGPCSSAARCSPCWASTRRPASCPPTRRPPCAAWVRSSTCTTCTCGP